MLAGRQSGGTKQQENAAETVASPDDLVSLLTLSTPVIDCRVPVAVILAAMKRVCFFVLVTAIAAVAIAADPPLVDGVSGAPLVWSDWVAKRGPVAVVVWASWAPDATSVVGNYQAIARAGREVGLHMVLLDVQETLADGRKALGGSSVNWIHDRHGALLKQYKVITVPSVIVVAADGTLLQRLEATPAALGSAVVR